MLMYQAEAASIIVEIIGKYETDFVLNEKYQKLMQENIHKDLKSHCYEESRQQTFSY